MRKIEESLFNLKKLDALSYQDSIIHKVDPRIKVVITLIYIFFIVSFGRHQFFALVPFLLYPLFLMYLGNISFIFILKKIVIVLPFALIIAIISYFSEKTIIFYFYSIPITTGLFTFVSILLRFFLTVWISFLLISVTGFIPICYALNSVLHIPSIFVNQLLFLYRYIFILIEESIRVIRAHQIRSFHNRIPLRTFGYLIGYLLLRTLNRAERIHVAMLARGFDGRVRLTKKISIHGIDILFAAGWIVFFCLARFLNLTEILGKFILGLKI